MSTPKDLYPLSAQNGLSIPLDIIDIVAAAKVAINATAATLVTLPESEGIVIFYSSVDCWVGFSGGLSSLPIADKTFYPDTTFVPAYTLITATIRSSNIYLSADTTEGSVKIQVARKWAGLALPRQINK